MSEPRRLLAEGNTFERDLLRAWDSRQPSEEARARALAVAGLGAALAAGAVAAGKAAGGSIAPKAAVASSALLKWLAVGAVGVILAGTVAYTLRPAPAPKARATTAVPVSTVPPPVAPPVAARDEAPVAPAPMTYFEIGPGTTRTKSTAAPASARSTLDDEVGSIEQARREVVAGDAAAALRLLDAYDAKYPAGSLAQESVEIRIEALVKEGNRSGAERLATRFIAAHPSSPYVRRIRALLASAPSP